MIPRSEAYVIRTQPNRYSEDGGDVIVTNKRIVPSFPSLLPWDVSENFGYINLWHPKIDVIPKVPDQPIVINNDFYNAKIKKIECLFDKDLGDYLRVDCLFFKYNFYHPKAREIYDAFSE